MRGENALRRRLTAAFLLLAVVIGGVFALSTYVIVEHMEYDLIDERLARVATQLGSQHGDLTSSRSDVLVKVGQDIPPELSGLSAGFHEIEFNGRIFHTLIGGQAGRRYAIIDDLAEFERIESVAFVGLWVVFVAGIVLALGIARALSNRTIAPLTALAAAVQHDNLSSHPQLLAAADEIGVLARALELKETQLRAFLARERLFTADVSHELRTPLTVIMGAAELLTARLANQPDLRSAAQRMERTSRDAAVLVSALLQLARSPEQLEQTSISLRDLALQEIERCRPLIDNKPVELCLDVTAAVEVHASRDLVTIALGNLLRNACYVTKQGRVCIQLSEHTLAVEDTGPGVPAAIQRRLFEPYVRSGDDPSSGAGLGLSIAKRATEHLGWTIHLERPPAGGSRFVLTF